jgi:hypothetical protein
MRAFSVFAWVAAASSVAHTLTTEPTLLNTLLPDSNVANLADSPSTLVLMPSPSPAFTAAITERLQLAPRSVDNMMVKADDILGPGDKVEPERKKGGVGGHGGGRGGGDSGGRGGGGGVHSRGTALRPSRIFSLPFVFARQVQAAWFIHRTSSARTGPGLRLKSEIPGQACRMNASNSDPGMLPPL